MNSKIYSKHLVGAMKKESLKEATIIWWVQQQQLQQCLQNSSDS